MPNRINSKRPIRKKRLFLTATPPAMRILKKLDIFILRNFLTLFLGTFVICLFIVMMQFLWKFVDDLVGKGLSFVVLAKFFFYAAETLVSLALPLAILLAALISFGNLGERLELLAIKAAGISLWRAMRPLAFLMLLFSGWSYYFQDVVAPKAQNKLMTMLYSIRQKSPELDIPEGVFYDGVEGMNLFVQRKDKETGILRGVIIYNMRDGVNNAHILLADSGKLESSVDKKHLLLRLWNGEQFENLQNGALETSNVPYRRETFVEKRFIIDFDQNLDLSDADFSSSARTKDIPKLRASIDSLRQLIDSTSLVFYSDMQQTTLYVPEENRPAGYIKRDYGVYGMPAELSGASGSLPVSSVGQPVRQSKKYKTESERRKEKVANQVPVTSVDIDSVFAHLSSAQQSGVLQRALQLVTAAESNTEFKSDLMSGYARDVRLHEIQIWQKLALALACLVFFFIGAPLGAIIRKGGLGMPVIVAVFIFIFYYIVNSFGEGMAKSGNIPPVIGSWISTLVLAPIGAFLTVKSNNDSVVFNIDAYHAFFRKLWGIRLHRHIVRKEVIINDPDYLSLADALDKLVDEARVYRRTQHLTRFPNYVEVYFRQKRDEQIEAMSDLLEYCVDALSNSKDHQILLQLNAFPILDAHAHTAPFHRRQWNICAGVFFPIGFGLLFRMARFRRRLRRDLKQIIDTGTIIAERCRELGNE